ncbi:RidA family protein [Salinarimonas sp. NSM]|uniref:RidA family protein n=1 Tax=Salinarimonas sp. NSM TaxID=3458003 RepID=UPI0040366145
MISYDASTTTPETSTPEQRLERLGLRLPERPPAPIGAFCNVRVSGGLAWVSGQGPVEASGRLRTGKVGADVTLQAACADARLVALNILAAVRTQLGSLDRISGVVKLTGLVNATPDFADHPTVIDAASTLIAEVFGRHGTHARTSYGVGSLPNQITVEIDAVLELAPQAR